MKFDGTLLVETMSSIALLAISAISYFIAKFFKNKTTGLKNENKNAEFLNTLSNVQMFIESLVIKTNQTVVNDLKKKGEFTSEKASEVFNAVFKTTCNAITDEAKAKIASVYGNIDEWFKTEIEKTIALQKQDRTNSDAGDAVDFMNMLSCLPDINETEEDTTETDNNN